MRRETQAESWLPILSRRRERWVCSFVVQVVVAVVVVVPVIVIVAAAKYDTVSRHKLLIICTCKQASKQVSKPANQQTSSPHGWLATASAG